MAHTVQEAYRKSLTQFFCLYHGNTGELKRQEDLVCMWS